MIKPQELEVHTYYPPPEGGPGDGGTAVQQSVESVIKTTKNLRFIHTLLLLKEVLEMEVQQ